MRSALLRCLECHFGSPWQQGNYSYTLTNTAKVVLKDYRALSLAKGKQMPGGNLQCKQYTNIWNHYRRCSRHCFSQGLGRAQLCTLLAPVAVLEEKFTLATTNGKPSDKSTVKGHGVFGKGATLYIVFNKVWQYKKKKRLHHQIVFILLKASSQNIYSTTWTAREGRYFLETWKCPLFKIKNAEGDDIRGWLCIGNWNLS